MTNHENTEIIFNYGILKEAVIKSKKPSSGRINVVLDEDKSPGDDSFLTFSATVVGKQSGLSYDDRCLVLQSNGGQKDNLYMIGKIDVDENENLFADKSEKEEGYFLKSPDGNTSAKVKNGSISLETVNSSFSIKEGECRLSINGADIMMRQSLISLSALSKNTVKSSVSMDSSGLSFFAQKKIVFDGTDTHIKADGNLWLTGPIDMDKTADTVSDELDWFKPLDQFYVKANSIAMDAQEEGFTFTGNTFEVHLGSSLLGSTIPGTGPLSSFMVDVLQGDIDFTIGLGSFNVEVENMTFIDQINLRCGTLLHPTAGGLTIGAFSTSLYLDTAYPFVGSSLDFSTGAFVELRSTNDIDIYSELGNVSISSWVRNISLDSTMNIDISSVLDTTISAFKNVSISSLLNTDIDATAKMTLSSLAGTDITTESTMNIESLIKSVIKSALLELKADVELKIDAAMATVKTQILDLTQTNMIQTKPLTVVPSGSGPFCAIKVCPLTGLPACGSVASG